MSFPFVDGVRNPYLPDISAGATPRWTSGGWRAEGRRGALAPQQRSLGCQSLKSSEICSYGSASARWAQHSSYAADSAARPPGRPANGAAALEKTLNMSKTRSRCHSGAVPVPPDGRLGARRGRQWALHVSPCPARPRARTRSKGAPTAAGVGRAALCQRGARDCRSRAPRSALRPTDPPAPPPSRPRRRHTGAAAIGVATGLVGIALTVLFMNSSKSYRLD
jgi:hypothetical protein